MSAVPVIPSLSAAMTVSNTMHYSLHFSNDLMFDFLDNWIQKKADLEEGRISKEDYIEWTINFK